MGINSVGENNFFRGGNPDYFHKDFPRPLSFEESERLLKKISKGLDDSKIMYQIPVFYILSNGNAEISRRNLLEGTFIQGNYNLHFEFGKYSTKENKGEPIFTHIEVTDIKKLEDENYLRDLNKQMNKIDSSLDEFFSK